MNRDQYFRLRDSAGGGGKGLGLSRDDKYRVTLAIEAVAYLLGFIGLGIWGLIDPNGVKVLVVYSNVTFLIPATKAVHLHRWTMAIIYVLMILASSFYHSCNNWLGDCILNADLLRKQDFFYAQLIMVITALYIIQFPPRWAFIERWLIIITAVALFLVEVTTNEPFMAQVIIAGIAFMLIIVYWIVYGCLAAEQTPPGPSFPPYDWEMFSLGVTLTGLACTLFATQLGWHNGYFWVHSVWHTVAALGQYFILCTRTAAPRNAAMDAKINKDVF